MRDDTAATADERFVGATLARWAVEQPTAVALQCQAQCLCWSDLHRQVEQLAGRLHTELGVNRAIALDVSDPLLLILAFLAVSRSGNRALVLDTGWPDAQRAEIDRSSRAGSSPAPDSVPATRLYRCHVSIVPAPARHPGAVAARRAPVLPSAADAGGSIRRNCCTLRRPPQQTRPDCEHSSLHLYQFVRLELNQSTPNRVARFIQHSTRGKRYGSSIHS